MNTICAKPVSFKVEYLDDSNRTHWAFVKSVASIKFYQDRFTVLSIEQMKRPITSLI